MRPVTKPLPKSIFDQMSSSPQRRKIDPLTLLRLQLQATIGSYCSFCEMPINVTQSVASKYSRELKRMPSLQQWSDLLLTCDFCRLHRTGAVTNLSNYLWPDTDETFSLDSTSPFIYAKKDVTYIVKPDPPTGESDAAEGSSGPSTKAMVIVSANSLSPDFAKAARTIALFQLNSPFYDASTNTYTISNLALQSRIDPRVDLRTTAWEAATQAIASLKQMKALTSYPTVFDCTVQSTAALAQASGFWSGWMTLLWQAFSDKELIRRTLLEISKRRGYQVVGYQTFPDGGTPPWTLFTGTAVDRLTF